MKALLLLALAANLNAASPFSPMIQAQMRLATAMREGKFGQARYEATQALMAAESDLGTTHPGIVPYLEDLAAVLRHQADYEGAEHCYLRALVLLDKDPTRGVIHGHLEAVAIEKGLKERPKPAPRPKVAGGFSGPALFENLAALEDAWRADPHDVEIGEKILKIHTECHGPAHPATGLTLYRLGKVKKSEKLMAQGLGILEKSLGKNHPEILKLKRKL